MAKWRSVNENNNNKVYCAKEVNWKYPRRRNFINAHTHACEAYKYVTFMHLDIYMCVCVSHSSLHPTSCTRRRQTNRLIRHVTHSKGRRRRLTASVICNYFVDDSRWWRTNMQQGGVAKNSNDSYIKYYEETNSG